jgi:hypothetical protein
MPGEVCTSLKDATTDSVIVISKSNTRPRHVRVKRTAKARENAQHGQTVRRAPAKHVQRSAEWAAHGQQLGVSSHLRYVTGIMLSVMNTALMP